LDPPDPHDPADYRKGVKIVGFHRNKKKKRKNAKWSPLRPGYGMPKNRSRSKMTGS